MTQYIALLRGINVGGKNKLPMKELRELLADLGYTKAQTYIQSGNVVFESEQKEADALGEEISGAIEKGHGFAPRVLILTADALLTAMAQNPFGEAEEEPKSLHLYFLAARAEDADLETLNEVKKANERFHLADSVFYLHAPDGIGRSKLAERAERALGVPATARNWRTVSKIAEMVAAE